MQFFSNACARKVTRTLLIISIRLINVVYKKIKLKTALSISIACMIDKTEIKAMKGFIL